MRHLSASQRAAPGGHLWCHRSESTKGLRSVLALLGLLQLRRRVQVAWEMDRGSDTMHGHIACPVVVDNSQHWMIDVHSFVVDKASQIVGCSHDSCRTADRKGRGCTSRRRFQVFAIDDFRDSRIYRLSLGARDCQCAKHDRQGNVSGAGSLARFL